MIKKFLGLLALLGSACLPAYAQNGVRYDSYAFAVVTGGTGIVAVPGAVVTVCTSAATGNPCSPTATIYSDAALQLPITLSQVTADAGGNFGFYIAPGRYTYTIRSASGLIGGPFPFTAPMLSDTTNIPSNLNGILYVGSAAWQYASLQAAQDALPSLGGTIVIVPGFIDTETSTIAITKNNVTILCQNQPHFLDLFDTEIVFNHASVGINVLGQDFGMDGCHLKVGTTTSRLNVPMIDSNTTSGGRLSNLIVTGQSASSNNGIFFRSTDTNVRQSFGWQLDNIVNRDGFTWTSIIKVSIASSSLTGAYYKFTDIVNSYGEKYTDAAVALDGTIDTVEMDRISVGNALAVNPTTMWLRNTVSASGAGFPRWVHCSNCYLEAGGGNGVTTGTGVQIDSGRDIDYWGYMAGAQKGFNITGSLVGVNIHDVAFTTMFMAGVAITGGTGITVHHCNFADTRQSAITYVGGGGLVADGNTFYDSSVQTTNTYDTISVAAGTGTIQITNSSWLNQTGNKPRYGINFLGAVNNAIVNGNNYAGVTFGTSFLNPPSSGSNIQILGQETSVLNRLMGYSLLGPVTVGALPAAAAGNKGQIITVSDSTAVAAEGQTCVGGSTNTALAFSNGAVWKCF